MLTRVCAVHLDSIEGLGGQNLSQLIVPFGLILGVLSVLNRIWLRYMVNQRKEMMKANAKLLQELQNTEYLSLAEIAIKRNQLQNKV